MKNEIKILMIDDDNEDYFIMNEIVSEIEHDKYVLEWASSYEEGMKKLLELRHDVYLIDYYLGKNTGLECLNTAIEKGCDKPIIILTGQNDFLTNNNVMLAGATDYLIKNEVTSRSLETTFRYAIANAKNKRELKELNADLERRVIHRTRALEDILIELEKNRKELNLSVKKEHHLNEMKSNFITTVSHEFRTPLTSIMSSLYLLSSYFEKKDVDNHNKHINRITDSIHYLTEMLNNMLSLNMLEEEKLIVRYEAIEIDEIIGEAVNELKILAKKDQKIKYDHSGTNKILHDKKIIKHIMENLISNALKFSEEGKKVYVRSDVSKNILTITVKDNGIGIAENDQQHLFQRFYRASNAINIQGTGLGLCIVSDYLKMIDGAIDLKSNLEEGTTITISIPVEITEKIAKDSEKQLDRSIRG